MAVVFSVRAQADLADILDFHADRDVRYATTLTDRLVDAALSLDLFPKRGSFVHGAGARYKRIVESGHVIIYALRDDGVFIVRVLHGSRDIDAILAGES